MRALTIAIGILAAFAILATLALASIPTCATEDSYGCVWHGGSNGIGSHYVTLGSEEGYVTIPLP